MKIVIDARMYGPKRWTGIGRYLQNLLAQLEKLDATNQYIVLLGRDNFDEYQPAAPNFHKTLAPYAPYSFGEQLGLAWLLWRLRPDLVHFASPNSPVLYPGRRVTTIHDFTLLLHNTSRYQGVKRVIGSIKRAVFRLVMRVAVRRSRLLLTPTHYVKRQLQTFYGVGPGKATVTPLSVDPVIASPEPIDRFGLHDGYLLYVGNCYPYKNVGRLIQAFAQLTKEHRLLKLVLVGRDDFFRMEHKRFVKSLGLDKRVVFTGAVSDGELVSLYQEAAAYVYPSLSEGFGLQGLEAMSQGVPVVAAEASCLPETCGEAAVYFDPYDVDDMTRKIAGVLSDPQVRSKLKEAGRKHLQGYSWERTAQATLVAYSRAGGER